MDATSMITMTAANVRLRFELRKSILLTSISYRKDYKQMMFPFLTIFMLFLAWFTYNRFRTEKQEKNMEKEFWEKEAQANSTRRKDLSSLPYIRIPMDSLPFGIRPEDSQLTQYETRIRELADKKILNLTGLTNTELKLKYGAPNLTFLTECDQNFTELVRTMQEWGTRLHELFLISEAEYVLSCAIRWGSDIRGSYLLLARIYQDAGNTEGIQWLRECAGQLNSLMKEPILAGLKEF